MKVIHFGCGLGQCKPMPRLSAISVSGKPRTAKELARHEIRMTEHALRFGTGISVPFPKGFKPL